MATKLQKVNQMQAEWLKSLSDSELDAIADKEIDLSGFADHELDSIINGTASPSLLARIKTTLKPKATTP